MKRKIAAIILAGVMMNAAVLTGCSGGANEQADTQTEADQEASDQDTDQEAADKAAALIDAIYVQERTDMTDEQCKEAREAWDALTEAQK